METHTLIAVEPAAGQGAEEKKPTGGLYEMLIPLALFLGVFYLVVWRPQGKKRKQEQTKREDMLKNLKKNDHVVTIGGIHGIVASVGESEVVLKVDERSDVRIRMARDAVNKVVGPEDEGGEKKDEKA